MKKIIKNAKLAWFLLFIVLVVTFAFCIVLKVKYEGIEAFKSTNTSKTFVLNSPDNIAVLIGSNKIVFQYKKTLPDGGGTAGYIDAEAYPKLFESLDYNVIKVSPFKVGDRNLYLLSNLYSQRFGDYTLHYAIVVDIFKKDNPILFETNDKDIRGWSPGISILDNGDIKLTFSYGYYDYCQSCDYHLVKYIGYDEQRGIFVTRNTKYIDTFKTILSDIEKNNHCSIVDGGAQLTFEEIKNKYGESYQCRSSAETPPLLGITPKEYFELKDKVNSIINGKEKAIF